jgi:hypothetical protein
MAVTYVAYDNKCSTHVKRKMPAAVSRGAEAIGTSYRPKDGGLD